MAIADPQTLLRVLGLFAQRWLMPDKVVVRVRGDVLKVSCRAPPLSAKDLDILAAKLREIVLVQEVVVEETSGEKGVCRRMR